MAMTVSNESDSHSNEWMSQQISGLVSSVMSRRMYCVLGICRMYGAPFAPTSRTCPFFKRAKWLASCRSRLSLVTDRMRRVGIRGQTELRKNIAQSLAQRLTILTASAPSTSPARAPERRVATAPACRLCCHQLPAFAIRVLEPLDHGAVLGAKVKSQGSSLVCRRPTPSS